MNIQKNLMAFATALCGLFSINLCSLAATWVQLTNAPTEGAQIVCSADGFTLATVGPPAGINSSTNGGLTWTAADVAGNEWRSLACSANGQVMIGISYPVSQYADYVSTNSGLAWNPITTIPFGDAWYAVAVSADGRVRAISCENDGLIYVSTNAGVTWATNNAPPSGSWFSMTISADGSKLFAAQAFGYDTAYIYSSSDSGNTWWQTGAASSGWSSVACSADGTKLIAAGDGTLYISSDSGTNWSPLTAPYATGTRVACSADGKKLIASGGNLVSTSTDSGVTWTSNNIPDSSWASVACSADGNKLFAGSVNDQSLWALQITPTPTLCVAGSASNLTVSWIVPSEKFVLEENSHLSLTNWIAVTNIPVLNRTNLQNQVTLAPSGTQAFYRLYSE